MVLIIVIIVLLGILLLMNLLIMFIAGGVVIKAPNIYITSYEDHDLDMIFSRENSTKRWISPFPGFIFPYIISETGAVLRWSPAHKILKDEFKKIADVNATKGSFFNRNIER